MDTDLADIDGPFVYAPQAHPAGYLIMENGRAITYLHVVSPLIR